MVEDTVDIPYAYVVYDDVRKRILPEIMSYLKRVIFFPSAVMEAGNICPWRIPSFRVKQ